MTIKRLNAILIVSFLIVISFSGITMGVGNPVPVGSQNSSPPITPQSIKATGLNGYINTTSTYWQNVAIANSGTTTVNMPATENSSYSSISFSTSNAWTTTSGGTGTVSSASFKISQAIPSAYFWTQTDSNTIQLDDIYFRLPVINIGGTDYTAITTVYANLTTASGLATMTWQYAFNYESGGGWAYINPQWNPYQFSQLPNPEMTTTMTLTLGMTISSTTTGADFSIVNVPVGINTTTFIQGQNTVNNVLPPTAPVPYAIGYHFAPTTSTYGSTDLTSYSVVTTNPQYSTSVSYNGGTAEAVPYTFTGSLTGFSLLFTPTVDPAVNGVSDITVNYYLSSQVQAQSTTATQSFNPAQSITNHQNWWNSTMGITYTNPSGALDNTALATTSGTINAGTYITWTTTMAVVGYGNSPAIDNFNYSGMSQTGSFTLAPTPPRYVSWTDSTSTLVPSGGLAINYGSSEFINFYPSVVNSHVMASGVPDQPLYVFVNATEQIAGESHQLFISANGINFVSSAITTSEALQSGSVSYNSAGPHSISWYVENYPNSATGSLSTTTTSGTVNLLPMILNPSPQDYATVGTSVPLALAFNTQTASQVTSVALFINGVQINTFNPDTSSGTVKYTYSQLTSSPLLVEWTVTNQYGYSQSVTFQYGSDLTPTAYSNKVVVLQSTGVTDSYPVAISGAPSGSGYYQQLFTFNDTNAKSLISGLNSKDSNFLIADTNGTPLYSWIEAYNSTSMSVWSKVPNGTTSVNFEVFPEFDNLFSANGYVGLAPQLSPTYAEYDNGKMVFPFYEDFKSGILKNFTTNYAQYLTFNDGLKILDGNSSLTVLSNISQGNSGTVLWNGEFNTGTSSTTVSQGTTTGPLYLGFQFTGNIANGFIWLNATAHPTQFMYDNSFVGGSNANYLTNTFQNYMVQTNESANGTQYMGFYLNNTEQQNAYTYNRNFSGSFGFSTQQQSVAYEIWHYVAETSFLFTKMPTYTITPQLNFTHTVYTYTVYIATVTNENPAYTASGLTNLTFKATGYSWAYFPSSDKLEVNPPPYLIFSNITGNYGVYNITMQMTATSNITHKTITATAYAEVTVIGYVRLNVTKITQSANSLFPTLTEREIMFLITAVVSIVVALILMSFVAERKVKRKEEEKYEKEWLKHD